MMTPTTPTSPWRVSYQPGEWTLLSGPSAVVVLEPAPARASAVIARIWELVLGATGPDDLVTRLASLGLDAMPNLAVIFRDAEGLHALLRGHISITDADGASVADGSGVRTWRECDLPGERVRLQIPGPGHSPDAATLPLLVGAARVAWVEVDVAEGAVPDLAMPWSAQSGAAEDSDAGGQTVEDAGGDQTTAGHVSPVAPGGPIVLAGLAAAPVVGLGEHAAVFSEGQPLEGQLSEDQPLVEQPATPEVPDDEPHPVEMPAEESGADEPDAEEPRVEESRVEGDQIDDMHVGEELPEVTRDDADRADHEVIAAASQPDAAADHTSTDAEGPVEDAPAEAQLPPWLRTPLASESEPAPMADLIEEPVDAPVEQPVNPYGVDNWAQPPAPYGASTAWTPVPPPGTPVPEPEPEPEFVEFDDLLWEPLDDQPASEKPAADTDFADIQHASIHDGQTLDQPAIAATHRHDPDAHDAEAPDVHSPDAADADPEGSNSGQTGVQQRSASEPLAEGQVLAQMCPRGHANRPGSRICRVCADDLDPAAPVQPAARQILAELLSNAGARVVIEGPVLIGRAPSAARHDPASVLLRVPSPSQDISRTHLLIDQDGWMLTITDLHSTNGTIVTPPGSRTYRLTPGETVPLEIGTVVDLGDGVTIDVAAHVD